MVNMSLREAIKASIDLGRVMVGVCGLQAIAVYGWREIAVLGADGQITYRPETTVWEGWYAREVLREWQGVDTLIKLARRSEGALVNVDMSRAQSIGHWAERRWGIRWADER